MGLKEKIWIVYNILYNHLVYLFGLCGMLENSLKKPVWFVGSIEFISENLTVVIMYFI